MASSPSRNGQAPPASGPGLLVFTGMSGGQLLSSICMSPPLATAQMRLSRLAGLDVEDLQLALLVFVVGLLVGVPLERPAAEDVVAVEDTIAVEPVEVLVQHGLAKRSSACGSRFGSGCPAKRAASMIFATASLPCSFKWMPLIVSGFSALAYNARVGWNRSTKTTPCLPRHLAHRLGVQSPGVCCSRCRRAGSATSGFRGRSARRARAAGRSCRCTSAPSVCLMNVSRSVLNFSSPASPRERFVVAEEREDHVGLGVGRLEAVVAQADACHQLAGSGIGADPESHWSGVPKDCERIRRVSSSPEKPRLRNVRSSLGNRLWM